MRLNDIGKTRHISPLLLIHEARLAAQSLRESPNRGRVVPELRDTSVREIFVKQYRLIYEVGSDRVIVWPFFTARGNFRRIYELRWSTDIQARAYTFLKGVFLSLEDDLLEQRLSRIARLKRSGSQPTAQRFDFTHTIPEILAT